MKVNWIGVLLVFCLAAGVYTFKHRKAEQVFSIAAQPRPEVLLIANPSDAASTAGCGEIIRFVRRLGKRGVPIQELAPDTHSELLTRYAVFTSPTVLILDHNGFVVRRFEGETPATVAAVRSTLERIQQ